MNIALKNDGLDTAVELYLTENKMPVPVSNAENSVSRCASVVSKRVTRSMKRSASAKSTP